MIYFFFSLTFQLDMSGLKWGFNAFSTPLVPLFVLQPPGFTSLFYNLPIIIVRRATVGVTRLEISSSAPAAEKAESLMFKV